MKTFKEAYLKQEKLVKSELINYLKNNIENIVNSVDMSYMYLDENEKENAISDLSDEFINSVTNFISSREKAAEKQQTPFPVL